MASGFSSTPPKKKIPGTIRHALCKAFWEERNDIRVGIINVDNILRILEDDKNIWFPDVACLERFNPMVGVSLNRQGKNKLQSLLIEGRDFKHFFEETGLHLRDTGFTVEDLMSLMLAIEEYNCAINAYDIWITSQTSFLHFLQYFTPSAALQKHKRYMDEEKRDYELSRQRSRDSAIDKIVRAFNKTNNNAIQVPNMPRIRMEIYADDPTGETSESSSGNITNTTEESVESLD